MKASAIVLIATGLLLAATYAGAEDRLIHEGNQWLGHVSNDGKKFTPCGGTADDVQDGDKVQKNVSEKCDSTTAYQPPEFRYRALVQKYNATHDASIKLVFTNGAEPPITDPSEVHLVRGGSFPSTLSRESTLVPVAVDAVVPVYNVPGTTSLRFTQDVLAKIFIGKITQWNDPAIKGINPGAALPDLPIRAVRRGDDASTTKLFVAFLRGSALSATTVKTDDDVVGFLRETPGALGYVDMMTAIRQGMVYGAVKNAHGTFVKASSATLVAASESTIAGGTTLIGASAENAYPISAYAFAAVMRQDRGKSPSDDVTRWLIDDGRHRAQQIGLTPVPEGVIERMSASFNQ